MPIPKLEKVGSDFLIFGDLTFSSILSLSGNEKLFKSVENIITIDLTNAKRVDSAGLALLISWKNYAKRQQKEMKFVKIPPQMQAMIDIRGISGVINASGKN